MLYQSPGPTGRPVGVPPGVIEAEDPYLKLRDGAALRAYYEDEGYVVFRGLVPQELCDRARAEFNREVKPYSGFIYRQATANPERHALDAAGRMLNSILNIQDLDQRYFKGFRQAGLAILTHESMQMAVRTLLGEPGKIVQSMYFEGNPVTWAHQDTYYLDSVKIGSMTAAWIAVEDIAPGAGRFYVYPRSHCIDMRKNGGDFDIAFNHDRYKRLVISVIENHGLQCVAPALRKGDVLFWSARTIHGSLPTTQPERSRSSFTAHFIPQSHGFLQHQAREKQLRLRTVNGVSVHHPKDQNILYNRGILWVETTFPKLFQACKRLAVKYFTH